MQATVTPPAPRAPRAPSPARVAESLLALWLHLMQGTGGRLFQVIEELDLSLTQMKVLDALGIAEEEPSVKGVSERVGCSLANASRAVEALHERGWVERREDPADRRVKRLAITPAGREALHRVNTARLEGLEGYAATLAPAQRSALHAALSGLPHATKDRR